MTENVEQKEDVSDIPTSLKDKELADDDDLFVWSRIVPSNAADDSENIPPPMRYHTAVAYKGVMYTFGGVANNKRVLNQVYAFNFESKQWSLVKCVNSPPSPRYGHCAVLYGNAMFVFGGTTDEKQAFSDFYSLNLDTFEWKEIAKTESNWPGERFHHGSLLHKSKLLIHGGAMDKKRYQSDLWIWDFEASSTSWTRLETIDNPSPRAVHAFFEILGSIYVYAGHAGDGGFDYLDDMHVLPIEGLSSTAREVLTWKPVEYVKAHAPSLARKVSHITADGFVWFFGGYDGPIKLPCGDLVKFNQTDKTWHVIPLWLDFESSLTAATTGSKGLVPTPRYGHVSIFDEESGQIYFHGGSGSTYLSDIFRVTLP